jgi:hypothetical protein
LGKVFTTPGTVVQIIGEIGETTINRVRADVAEAKRPHAGGIDNPAPTGKLQ